MPSRSIPVALALVVLVLAACGDAPPADGPTAETPEAQASAVLAEMLAVAEKGDWGAYVDGFYGEQHKFGSPADRDALVKRFEAKWGEQVVEGLRRAAKTKPRIEGDMALFEENGQPVFVLHRTADGGWSFHL